MPRKDPITGCMVMTTPEFFAREAEREGLGRSGADVMTDMFEEMAAEEAEVSAQIASRPVELLWAIREAMYCPDCIRGNPCRDRCFDLYNIEPLGVHQVIKVDISASLGGPSGELYEAIVVWSDGTKRYTRVTVERFSGSFYEPPWEDVDMEIACPCGATLHSDTPDGVTSFYPTLCADCQPTLKR